MKGTVRATPGALPAADATPATRGATGADAVTPAAGVPDGDTLAAARQGDGDAFGRLVDPHRVEIRAHCYRMLGSLQDAEDVTQEVMMRAWRHLGGFDERSSLRTWLYRIATNACLTAMATRARRRAPQEAVALSPPSTWSDDPESTDHLPPGVAWLDPFPDAGLDAVDPAPGPEATVTARESVRLAFVAAAQHLPARQRAVLLLRDVLGYTAAETADLLETTPAAVDSAMQRARATMRDRAHEPPPPEPDVEKPVVDRFVQRWAAGDWDGLASLLAADILMTMPPFGRWFRGRRDTVDYLTEVVSDEIGTARLVPVSANGLPAFACYQRDEDGRDACIGVMLLRVEGESVAEIIGFPGMDATPFGAPAVREVTEPRP